MTLSGARSLVLSFATSFFLALRELRVLRGMHQPANGVPMPPFDRMFAVGRTSCRMNYDRRVPPLTLGDLLGELPGP